MAGLQLQIIFKNPISKPEIHEVTQLENKGHSDLFCFDVMWTSSQQ